MKIYGQSLLLLSAAFITVACSHVPAEEGTAPSQPADRGAELTAEAPKLTEKKTDAAELAERKTEENGDNAPGFFARLFGWGKDETTDTPAETDKKTSDVQPTPAQQAAAHRMLDAADIPAPSPDPLTAGSDDGNLPPAATRNGLRLGNFAPPEEAASSAENTPPRPNKVELRGLRSPVLNGGSLPMDINGKLTPETHD